MSATDLQGAGRETPSASELSKGDGEAKERLRRATETLKTSARRYLDTAQRQAGAIQDRGLQAIRERPAATVGSAVAVALVTGVILGFVISNALSGRDTD